jgi:lipopolysaccharide export system protein LptA
LRNQEAARYARWAAWAATAITLVVASFYGQRAIHRYVLTRHGPAPVPVTVQQQSADFSYSDVEDGRTIFTVRASHATQFKDQDLAELQDVWVTLYGRQGDRNDNIHTQECSYQPKAGAVRCAGDVDIDIQAANPSSASKSDGTAAALFAQALHVKTSNLTFNRETGEASTPAPVNLTFEGGQGHGDGLHYSAHDSVVRVDHGVALQMAASARTGGLPVSATAGNLEFRRDDHAIALGGPVSIHQGDRELAADRVSIGLDQQYRAQAITAEGSPTIRTSENGAQSSVTANRFNAAFDATGAVQHIVADGSVNGMRKTKTGDDHFSAGHVEFAMLPHGNQLKDMTATGNVIADSRDGANTRALKTDALRIAFAPPAAASADHSATSQRIESAETLAPATIDSKSADDSVNLKAAQFVAEFDSAGKLSKLLGHSGVQIARTWSNGAPQSSTASELTATFGSGGQWATLDETGNVKLAQGEQHATASHIRAVSATDQITLDGSPVISDATSQTSAGSVAINQTTGDIQASGRVVSTEFSVASSTARPSAFAGGPLSLGEGAAHITSDSLDGSTKSGQVAFLGHARLWQGQAVLSADRIDVSKDDGSLRAAGNVVGVFPQASGQMAQMPTVPVPGRKSAPAPSRLAATPAPPAAAPEPTLWQVRAPSLAYTSGEGKAHLEGGVTATSAQGTMKSQTLDVFLAATSSVPNAPIAANGSAARALDHVLAQGGVTVTQGAMQGKSDQALYSAADGKFVLSGGQPTITDSSGNTTTGRSLTFYVASDTISVDSEQGSRTLTKHRVEK